MFYMPPSRPKSLPEAAAEPAEVVEPAELVEPPGAPQRVTADSIGPMTPALPGRR